MAADPRTDDVREALIPGQPPSAVAAGIIARRELSHGVAHGPANEVAGRGGRRRARPPQRHDELHPAASTSSCASRDGIRLTGGAHALEPSRAWRQLSVRRLLILIRPTLVREMQWAVFEPNDAPPARRGATADRPDLLRRLFRAGAFAGATEEEAFFVRCDEALNPRAAVDAGQLVAEIGVAPAEPLEFIVVRLAAGRRRHADAGGLSRWPTTAAAFRFQVACSRPVARPAPRPGVAGAAR